MKTDWKSLVDDLNKPDPGSSNWIAKRRHQTGPTQKPYARMLLFRWARKSRLYTDEDAAWARRVLGDKEADRIIHKAKKYDARSGPLRILPGSYGHGKIR